MFRRLLHEWVPGRSLSPTAVADKVKRFFFFYAANRHKARFDHFFKAVLLRWVNGACDFRAAHPHVCRTVVYTL